MNKIFSIFSLIFSALAALLIGYMYIGMATGAFDNGAGMAILFFQFWGIIFALIGFTLTTIAFFIAANKNERLHKFGRISRWLALGSIGALILGYALT